MKLNAAEALGKVGTVRAIGPLMASARGILMEPDFRSSASRAVAVIRARLRDPDRGRLSIADDDGPVGGVSLVEHGHLSDPEQG